VQLAGREAEDLLGLLLSFRSAHIVYQKKQRLASVQGSSPRYLLVFNK